MQIISAQESVLDLWVSPQSDKGAHRRAEKLEGEEDTSIFGVCILMASQGREPLWAPLLWRQRWWNLQGAQRVSQSDK